VWPHETGEALMALDPRIRKNWEEIQKRHPHPVNAIGVKITEKDKDAYRIWKEEGIDKFVKK
jgi:hypothetical protein